MRSIEEIAESVVRFALHDMRRDANRRRLLGLGASLYQIGSVEGQLLVAQFDLRADPVLIQAAQNEVRFLAYDYTQRSA